jgi:predicted transcriptional regulator
MHSPVITIDAKESVKRAVDIMEKHSISQMPVLKENRIIGGIREATIINCILRSGNPEKIFSGTIYSIMERKFPTVNPSTSIEEVVYMLSQDQPAVIVMNNNKLIGIITKIDAISSAINFKRDESGSQ